MREVQQRFNKFAWFLRRLVIRSPPFYLVPRTKRNEDDGRCETRDRRQKSETGRGRCRRKSRRNSQSRCEARRTEYPFPLWIRLQCFREIAQTRQRTDRNWLFELSYGCSDVFIKWLIPSYDHLFHVLNSKLLLFVLYFLRFPISILSINFVYNFICKINTVFDRHAVSKISSCWMSNEFSVSFYILRQG